MNSKKAYHFKLAMLVIAVSIFVFAAAFFTADHSTTGFVVSQESANLPKSNPILINSAKDLSSLSSGNYYIDKNANVLWIDDESRPVVAKLTTYNEDELDRTVYVSIEGEVFFVR